MLHSMVPIFIILARVIIMARAFLMDWLYYIRVIFLILARAIVMEHVILLFCERKGICSAFFMDSEATGFSTKIGSTKFSQNIQNLQLFVACRF